MDVEAELAAVRRRVQRTIDARVSAALRRISGGPAFLQPSLEDDVDEFYRRMRLLSTYGSMVIGGLTLPENLVS